MTWVHYCAGKIAGLLGWCWAKLLSLPAELWAKILGLSREAWEWIASIPPMAVFVASISGADIQWWFYAVSIVWVLLQIYFRLRKEYAKWRAKQYLDPEDTDYKAPT